MHTTDISRSTNDGDRRQASHPQLLLRVAMKLTTNDLLIYSLAVSCYMVSGALGNLTWSNYAGFCQLYFSYSIYLSCCATCPPTTPWGGNQPPTLMGLRRLHFTDHHLLVRYRWQTSRLPDCTAHICHGLVRSCARTKRSTAVAFPSSPSVWWRWRHVNRRWRYQ